MDITIWISQGSSSYLLFISVMQLVKGAQFLSITFLFQLFGAAALPVFGTVKVCITSM